MGWFANMKIGAKLMVGFILISLVAGVIGLVGISNLSTISKEDRDLYVGNTLPIAQINKAAVYYQRIRVNLRDVIINHGQVEKVKTCKANIEDFTKIIQDQLDVYGKSINSDKERQLYNDVKAQFVVFNPGIQKVMEKALAGDANGVTKGIADLATVVKAIEDDINEITELNTDEAQKCANGNTASAGMAIKIMITMVIFGVLMAFGI